MNGKIGEHIRELKLKKRLNMINDELLLGHFKKKKKGQSTTHLEQQHEYQSCPRQHKKQKILVIKLVT